LDIGCLVVQVLNIEFGALYHGKLRARIHILNVLLFNDVDRAVANNNPFVGEKRKVWGREKNLSIFVGVTVGAVFFGVGHWITPLVVR